VIVSTARLLDAADRAVVLDFSDPALGLLLNYVDIGFGNVRGSATPRTGQDGTVDVTSFVAEAPVTAEVTLPAVPASYYQVEDRLRALMHPSLRYYLHVLRPGWPAERRTLVRAASFACPPARPKVAQLGWVAVNGTFEDAASTSITLSPLSNAESGLSTPIALPAAFPAGYLPGQSSVTIGGTAPTLPIVHIYGPVTNPKVVFGQLTWALNGSIGAQDYLHVNFADRVVWLNSDPNQSMYGQVDFTATTWWSMPPGRAQIGFYPDVAAPPAQAVVTWRNRYL